MSIADTTTLRWLDKQGVAAILLGDANHVGGDIGTNNGASRVKGAPQFPPCTWRRNRTAASRACSRRTFR